MAALLLVPTGWIVAGLLATVAVRLGIRLARRWQATQRARRAAASALHDASGPITLGIDASGRAVALSAAQLSAHGLILGASGAGKSTTLLRILTAQIRRGQPVVAIDLKGSPAFAATLRDAAAAAGRRFRCWTPDGPELWNPLAHGNATELKDKLIATERFTEPHYQRAAERYVQTALQVLQADIASGPVTLARVVEALDPLRLAATARRVAPELAARVGEYLASLTPDQLSAVRGLASRLAIISESHTGAFLDGRAGGIDLEWALAGNEVVLFSLNSSTYGRLTEQLGTLAVQDLVSIAGRRLAGGAVAVGRQLDGGAVAAGRQLDGGAVAVDPSSAPMPDRAVVAAGTETTADPAAPGRAAQPLATIGIDEFSALGSDNLMALLARGREAGVSVLLATQELADLDRSARGLRDQVLGNTAVKIAHRQDVPQSAETVARLAGTVRDWERSYAIRPGRWGGADLRHGTLRQVDRFVVEPDRVRTLQTGEAVVIVKTPSSRTHVTQVLRPPARSRDRGFER